MCQIDHLCWVQRCVYHMIPPTYFPSNCEKVAYCCPGYFGPSLPFCNIRAVMDGLQVILFRCIFHYQRSSCRCQPWGRLNMSVSVLCTVVSRSFSKSTGYLMRTYLIALFSSCFLLFNATLGFFPHVLHFDWAMSNRC